MTSGEEARVEDGDLEGVVDSEIMETLGLAGSAFRFELALARTGEW